jgi:hypothetical protein
MQSGATGAQPSITGAPTAKKTGPLRNEPSPCTLREGPVKIEKTTLELQEAVAEVAVNTGTWSIVLAAS